MKPDETSFRYDVSNQSSCPSTKRKKKYSNINLFQQKSVFIILHHIRGPRLVLKKIDVIGAAD